jgi:hypothetical protein
MQIDRNTAYVALVIGALALGRGLWVTAPPKHLCTDTLSQVRWYSKFILIISGAGLIFGSMRVLIGF